MGTNRGVSTYLKNIWKFQNLAEASLKMLMRIQLTFQDLIKNDEELPTSKKRNYFFIDSWYGKSYTHFGRYWIRRLASAP